MDERRKGNVVWVRRGNADFASGEFKDERGVLRQQTWFQTGLGRTGPIYICFVRNVPHFFERRRPGAHGFVGMDWSLGRGSAVQRISRIWRQGAACADELSVGIRNA